jgi:hypothetical protein
MSGDIELVEGAKWRRRFLFYPLMVCLGTGLGARQGWAEITATTPDGGSVTAQAPGDRPSAPAASRTEQTEDVVVTARRREERAQDVPIPMIPSPLAPPPG